MKLDFVEIMKRVAIAPAIVNSKEPVSQSVVDGSLTKDVDRDVSMVVLLDRKDSVGSQYSPLYWVERIYQALNAKLFPSPQEAYDSIIVQAKAKGLSEAQEKKIKKWLGAMGLAVKGSEEAMERTKAVDNGGYSVIDFQQKQRQASAGFSVASRGSAALKLAQDQKEAIQKIGKTLAYYKANRNRLQAESRTAELRGQGFSSREIVRGCVGLGIPSKDAIHAVLSTAAKITEGSTHIPLEVGMTVGFGRGRAGNVKAIKSDGSVVVGSNGDADITLPPGFIDYIGRDQDLNPVKYLSGIGYVSGSDSHKTEKTAERYEVTVPAADHGVTKHFVDAVSPEKAKEQVQAAYGDEVTVGKVTKISDLNNPLCVKDAEDFKNVKEVVVKRIEARLTSEKTSKLGLVRAKLRGANTTEECYSTLVLGYPKFSKKIAESIVRNAEILEKTRPTRATDETPSSDPFLGYYMAECEVGVDRAREEIRQLDAAVRGAMNDDFRKNRVANDFTTSSAVELQPGDKIRFGNEYVEVAKAPDFDGNVTIRRSMAEGHDMFQNETIPGDSVTQVRKADGRKINVQFMPGSGKFYDVEFRDVSAQTVPPKPPTALQGDEEQVFDPSIKAWKVQKKSTQQNAAI